MSNQDTHKQTPSSQLSPAANEASKDSPTTSRNRSQSFSGTTLHEARTTGKMDDKTVEKPAEAVDQRETEPEPKPDPTPAADPPKTEAETSKSSSTGSGSGGNKTKTSHDKCRKPAHKKRSAAKSAKKHVTTDLSDSDESEDTPDTSSDSDSEDDSSSDDERSKRKKKSKKASKLKKRRKSSSESDDSEDDEPVKSKSKKSRKDKSKGSKKSKKSKAKAPAEEEPSESEADTREAMLRQLAKRGRPKQKPTEESEEEESDASSQGSSDEGVSALQAQIQALQLKLAEKQATGKKKSRGSAHSKSSKAKSKKDGKKKEASPDFKRVDQLWDSKTHNYQLKDSADVDETEYAEYAFLVRRCFNWENKYTDTVVDIKSKLLRAALTDVMKDCKSVSLEAEEPTIDPNILFLYLEELRTYYKKTLKSKIKAEKKRKAIKKLEQQRSLTKTLVSYIDEDYAETKKTLYPLLEAGNITFDLMWALFKPNEIAVTSCYGAWDEPRCFKVEYANKFCTMQRGEWYCIEGKYLEYDGKTFGYGDFEVEIDAFKGPRKITSLATYPLKYHQDADAVKKKIIERGERFVSMEGMQYKFHKGLAFLKKKRQVAKININGRVMIDPATFRRINPNYPISLIKPKDTDDLYSADEDEDDCCSCAGKDSGDEDVDRHDDLRKVDLGDYAPKYKYRWESDGRGHAYFVQVEVDEDGNPITPQRVDGLAGTPDLEKRKWTKDELLLTSPVVIGFAFSEKLWLEFSLSGVREIEWNDRAFDSLVLPDNQKEIVRALVASHKFNAAKPIDDVVQGKGKGLVSVLHGPPGTGKTLTAEGISELLRCPLYMVSAGELGTDPVRLERELQTILDIAHSWGAVLLLDEADVFLEARQNTDLHRNALVSIFLRLLEYFQGILFLTTNRVDSFDEAFQSRIHLPLRYGELTNKAKKAVWKMFLDLVRASDESSVVQISDYDLDILSRHQMNGRQIKNAVRTAQALALKEGKIMTLEHVRKVLEVSESFERDLKGGTGYLDAMRSYT